MYKTKKKYTAKRSSKNKYQVKEVIERLDKIRDEISEAWDDVTVEEELNEQQANNSKLTFNKD